MERQHDVYKVIIKLTQDGASFGEWYPIQSTKILNRMLGEIKCAKLFHDGFLLVICGDSASQGKAIRMSKIEG